MTFFSILRSYEKRLDRNYELTFTPGKFTRFIMLNYIVISASDEEYLQKRVMCMKVMVHVVQHIIL